MGQPCTVCRHAEVEAVNQAIVAGVPMTTIAERFGLARSSVQRHAAEHVPATLAQAQEAAEVGQADRLLAQVTHWHKRAEHIYRKAAKDNDWRSACSSMREGMPALELAARLAGQLQTATQVNILLAPQFIHLQAAMFDTLARWPEAREALRLLLAQVARGQIDTGTGPGPA